MNDTNQEKLNLTLDGFFNMMGLNSDKEGSTHSDIEWIFLNGKDVLKNKWKASLVTLAKYMEIDEKAMWGSHGEGGAYKDTCEKLLMLATPFLLSKNKEGYIDITSKILKEIISKEDIYKLLELESAKGEIS